MILQSGLKERKTEETVSRVNKLTTLKKKKRWGGGQMILHKSNTKHLKTRYFSFFFQALHQYFKKESSQLNKISITFKNKM